MTEKVDINIKIKLEGRSAIIIRQKTCNLRYTKKSLLVRKMFNSKTKKNLLEKRFTYILMCFELTCIHWNCLDKM